MEREQLDALLVDLHVPGVHLPVALDDLLRQLAVAVDERAHDAPDLVLDQPAHREQGLLERVELLVEMP